MEQKAEVKHELAGIESNPAAVVNFGSKVASMLKDIISKKQKKVIINGEQYLEFEDWQTVAKFYNVSVQVEWTKEIRDFDENKKLVLLGYEARATAIRKDGSQLSAAESMCLRTEKLWKDRELFQVKSMAQTRACAKALRNVFSWVVVLAGYQAATPDEVVDYRKI